MRSAVTLYEFMPYGAPELLESRRRHMSRALVATSLAALALYALTRVVMALMPAVPAPLPVREISVDAQRIDILQPPLDVMPPAAPSRPTAVVHEAATPVPVRDEIAKPSDIPAPPTPTTGETGPAVAIAPTEAGVQGTATEALPEFGKWVYVEHEPVPLTEVKPDYPRIAQEAGIEGRVTVYVLIGKDGRVVDTVLSKQQVPMLNQAALDAARRWVFTPGLANGQPVACWTAIPFHFRLH
jgi:protein TonB